MSALSSIMDAELRGDIAEVRPASTGSDTAPSPCFHCLNGDPHLCVGVSCWRCSCGCRSRLSGFSITEARSNSGEGGSFRFGQLETPT